jgi:hypothetical protein
LGGHVGGSFYMDAGEGEAEIERVNSRQLKVERKEEGKR